MLRDGVDHAKIRIDFPSYIRRARSVLLTKSNVGGDEMAVLDFDFLKSTSGRWPIQTGPGYAIVALHGPWIRLVSVLNLQGG